MTTKHMNASPGDFAEIVLMPGDPIRAKYIADSYLDNARLITDVRNMLGFTGEFRGKKISVMSHGMGIPSASIYCTELIKDYDVKCIIRVGSCGTSHPSVKLRDIIIAMGASTDSNFNRIRFSGHDYAALGSFNLLEKAVKVAKSSDINHHVGNIFSSDFFYSPDSKIFQELAKYNIYGVEMETAGIYSIAAENRVDALSICTVSDNVISGEALSSEDRATTFDEMILMALEVIS